MMENPQVITEHSHAPAPTGVEEIAVIREQMRNRAVTSRDKPAVILAQALQTASKGYVSTTIAFSEISMPLQNLRSTHCHHRKAALR